MGCFRQCQEHAHRMKWTLDQDASDLAQSQTLRGWKRICGYAAIWDDLKDRQQPCTGDAIIARETLLRRLRERMDGSVPDPTPAMDAQHQLAIAAMPQVDLVRPRYLLSKTLADNILQCATICGTQIPKVCKRIALSPE